MSAREASYIESPPMLRVASWNLHSCSAGLPRVAAQLAEVGADLVALQEVDRATLRSGGIDQAAALARSCGLEHLAYFPAVQWSPGEYGLALLSRWPLTEPAVAELPVPDGIEPRVLGSAKLVHPLVDLTVHVTHLSHRIGAGRVRAAQAQHILRLIGGSGPQLLLGDLNDLPGSRAHRVVCSRLTDVFREVGSGPGGTHKLGGVLPAIRIDYLFASRDIEVYRAHVVRTEASDHHLLVADLAAPGRAAASAAAPPLKLA